MLQRPSLIDREKVAQCPGFELRTGCAHSPAQRAFLGSNPNTFP